MSKSVLTQTLLKFTSDIVLVGLLLFLPAVWKTIRNY